MYRVKTSKTFRAGRDSLGDERAKGRIAASISKLKRGLMPDHKRIGDGVFELRIEYGPVYRLYFAFQEEKLILLLCGGDKGSQKRDIEKAKKMWEARKNG
jgi:putative addiction module killer protein